MLLRPYAVTAWELNLSPIHALVPIKKYYNKLFVKGISKHCIINHNAVNLIMVLHQLHLKK
jgi:hypothetical protein